MISIIRRAARHWGAGTALEKQQTPDYYSAAMRALHIYYAITAALWLAIVWESWS